MFCADKIRNLPLVRFHGKVSCNKRKEERGSWFLSRVVRGQLKLSSCVGVGFNVWYRTGVSVGRISGAVGGVPGAGWEIVF